MPGLSTRLHLDMLNLSKKKRKLLPRLVKAITREWMVGDLYGLEWGDPETVPPLKFIRDHYVIPYVDGEHCAIEIGPGGGRWTRYLLGFRKLHVVDYYTELLRELKKNFNASNMHFIKNNGTDFPGIEKESIDYLFSFGTFVHLDLELIEQYLISMKPLLKKGANAVIQYSDKTKIMAQINDGFAENSPEAMRKSVLAAGFKILEEDLTTMWHSSVIRFTI